MNKKALIINLKNKKLTEKQKEMIAEFNESKSLVGFRDQRTEELPEFEIIDFKEKLNKVERYLNDLG